MKTIETAITKFFGQNPEVIVEFRKSVLPLEWNKDNINICWKMGVGKSNALQLMESLRDAVLFINKLETMTDEELDTMLQDINKEV